MRYSKTKSSQITLILACLAFVSGQSDDSDLTPGPIQENTSASKQTVGAVLLMTAIHPALGFGFDEPSIITNNNSSGIKIMESSESWESGTKTGIQTFEQYSGGAFVKTVADLPFTGQVDQIPWPSEYWPNYKDGINVRTDPGGMTAVEKYAQAFGQDVQKIKDEVSKSTGVDAWAKNKACSSDYDCPTTDYSKCAIREGFRSGYCIPTWYGICHSWYVKL